MNKLLTILLSLFFVVCVFIHVYGLFYHVSDESILSHIVHIVSYSACFAAVVKNFKFPVYIYWLGAVYPFMFHAVCLYKSVSIANHISGICLLVVVLLPVAGCWIQIGRK
jgi:hypothetical protein